MKAGQEKVMAKRKTEPEPLKGLAENRKVPRLVVLGD